MSTGTDTITVKITGLAVGGACIGQITAGPSEIVGKKAFVRDTIPGEEAECRIEKDHDRFVEAALIQIGSAVPERKTPPCPYVADCGGCDLQHMSIAKQRSIKRLMIEQLLARQAGITLKQGVELIGPDLPEFGYRNRIALHVSSTGEVGYYRRNSGTVVDIAGCLLANQSLNDELTRLRVPLRNAAAWISEIILDNPAEGGTVHVVAQIAEAVRVPENFRELPEIRALLKVNPAIEFEHEGNIVFHDEPDDGFPAGHFSQVNRAGNELLIREVLSAITSPVITELYAGSGNFSLPLARAGKQVEAVEIDPELVEYGMQQAVREGVARQVQFFTMDCEQFVKVRPLQKGLLLDPPRSGAKEIVSRLDSKVVQEIVYISCSLPMLARDLKILLQRGFVVERVLFVDMFAQTHHVETIAILHSVNR